MKFQKIKAGQRNGVGRESVTERGNGQTDGRMDREIGFTVALVWGVERNTSIVLYLRNYKVFIVL